MLITEVRIKLCEENNERLMAFCSITFDNMFVVRDLKIIEGTKGVFVAMPSRKLTDRCTSCGYKNHLRARYCNSCGHRLDESRASRDMDGRAKLHADIAHPINSAAREVVQAAIVKAYGEERERAKQPGYVCRYDEYEYDYDDTPISYGTVVQEVNNRPNSNGGYKTHGPHQPASRGTHMNREAPAAPRAKVEGEFGAGIL